MPTVNRILVATDFSSDARSALESARAIARGTSARLEVVYVWQPPHGLRLETRAHGGKTLSDLARKEAARRMRHFLDGAGAGPAPRIEVGVPHEVIVTLAASESFDLIVMGASGAGSNPSRVGSVTRRVLDSAPCPVLTLRAPLHLALRLHPKRA
jgi:nucleotide-binding universal stress UspA family protein